VPVLQGKDLLAVLALRLGGAVVAGVIQRLEALLLVILPVLVTEGLEQQF
jgi:hypothetical protein